MRKLPDHVDWRREGVRIVKADELDFNTAQTPGMSRAAAINFAKAGANKLWAGTVSTLAEDLLSLLDERLGHGAARARSKEGATSTSEEVEK